MNLYQSGTPKNDVFQEVENGIVTHRLFSLHGPYRKAVIKWAENVRHHAKRPTHIMLDSGAFSAWNKGHEATLENVIEAYDEFLQVAGDLFEEIWMINLDKIPGSKGGPEPTIAELNDATRISDENLSVLQHKFGDRILPVFHQGESPERLEVVKSQTHYICISPRNDLPEHQRRNWSMEVHGRTKENRTHGLATTGNDMMRLVPWYSVDSAAWVLHSAYGIVDIFMGDRYKGFFFSHEGGKQKEEGIHYDTVTDALRARIDERLKLYPFTVQEIRENARARSLINLGEIQASCTLAKTATKGAVMESLFGF
jgi:hypothetical protein